MNNSVPNAMGNLDHPRQADATGFLANPLQLPNLNKNGLRNQNKAFKGGEKNSTMQLQNEAPKEAVSKPFGSKVFRRRKTEVTQSSFSNNGTVGQPKTVNKNYGKVFAEFKCNNEDCGKSWKSAHGWTPTSTSNLDDYCHCNGRAKIVKMLDEMMWVEQFCCKGDHGNVGENTWISLSMYSEDSPYEKAIEDCDLCGQHVESEGKQNRFGRHYTMQCQNKNCGDIWEEANMDTEYTQSCSKCKASGNYVGSRRATPKDSVQRGGFRGGSHNVESCGMCQKLQTDGIARSCTRKQHVIVQRKIENGVILDTVISVRGNPKSGPNEE